MFGCGVRGNVFHARSALGLWIVSAYTGGNVTGFMVNDFSMGGKWLELLKQIAPSTTRAAALTVCV